ncbi:hypothetical protein C2S51_022794 [Perilla frutescens var. frutescens]|nr:hypothetical protein C2S51_022794 [Perilla frutescens var. frutescens]
MENISVRFLAVILAALFLRQAFAAKHTVGGSQEFKYSSGLHNVVELPSESAFKSCDISVASNSLSGGDSKVKLNKAGTRFFACGTSGHCQQGMKVKITTVAADATPSSSTSTPTSPTGASTTPAATTQSSTASRNQFLSFFALVSSFMVFIALFM